MAGRNYYQKSKKSRKKNQKKYRSKTVPATTQQKFFLQDFNEIELPDAESESEAVVEPEAESKPETLDVTEPESRPETADETEPEPESKPEIPEEPEVQGNPEDSEKQEMFDEQEEHESDAIQLEKPDELEVSGESEEAELETPDGQEETDELAFTDEPDDQPEPSEGQKPSEEPEAENETESESDSDRMMDSGDLQETNAGQEEAAKKHKKPRRVRSLREKAARKRRIRAALGALLAAAAVCGVVYLVLPYECVRYEITVEAGESCPGMEAFLRWNSTGARFASEIEEGTEFPGIGDYGTVIYAYGRKVASVIHVRDTVAPEVSVEDITVYFSKALWQSMDPNDFIAEIEDVTETTVSFKTEPDYTAEGTQTVVILVEDEGGNVTEASLTIVYDSEAPEITGVEELTMTVGGSVSYKKGVSVTDNCDENVELVIDTSQVDTSTAGDYEIIYTAEDSAGNQTSVSTTLHVKEVTLDTVTEEAINQKADELLATILTDSMSEYEKAKAIYWWCHENIAYSDGTPKTNWIEGAYRGLVYRKGDCYTYASTAKCLLTRAGIKNMDIERIPEGNSMHYWNLIDIGEGWYHFDTCRRADGSTFFYKTDAEIKAYSDAHNGTHNYDRTLYPEIQ